MRSAPIKLQNAGMNASISSTGLWCAEKMISSSSGRIGEAMIMGMEPTAIVERFFLPF